MRAAVITDIHVGLDSYTSKGMLLKSGKDAIPVLEDFIRAVNALDVDCVIDLGDRISAIKTSDDVRNLQSVKDRYNTLSKPLYYIPGNNEYRNLDACQIELLTGYPSRTYSDVVNGVHTVFWNCDVYHKYGFMLSDQDLNDLQTTLDRHPAMPTIVCTHIPLDNNSERRLEVLKSRGLPETHGRYGLFHYPNAHKARAIIENHGHVAACLAGHRHTSRRSEINGIHYFTLDSPIGLRKSYKGKIPKTYAIIDILPGTRSGNIELWGHRPENFTFSY